MAFNVEIIGVAAAIFTTAAFVPQVYKTYKTKSVNELSLGMYLVFLTGLILWLTYGILINSFAIILANTITTILVMVLIYFILRYKK
ncbi:MAG: SemiSWEET transporter [Flavobacteriaceae bacterium]|jgi:MtN3 and saliva related transmembrane protein|nr:SemiSWEET transporter [Flavobacteriaceae bacterium]